MYENVLVRLYPRERQILNDYYSFLEKPLHTYVASDASQIFQTMTSHHLWYCITHIKQMRYGTYGSVSAQIILCSRPYMLMYFA